MGRRNRRYHSQITKQNETDICNIPIAQQKHPQPESRSSPRTQRPQLKKTVIVLLENGRSFDGTAVAFDNPSMPKCKIFFKDKNRKEVIIPVDVSIKSPDSEKIAVLQSTINNHLIQLHEEARLEFPEWLEKYSARVDEQNPFFNLDEIREEFKFKRSRFGAWRIAAQLGFFSDISPQYASFNKIVHLEIREKVISG